MKEGVREVGRAGGRKESVLCEKDKDWIICILYLLLISLSILVIRWAYCFSTELAGKFSWIENKLNQLSPGSF